MTNKDLIQRIAANHLRKQAQDSEPESADPTSKQIQAIATQLRTTATKSPLIRLRFMMALIEQQVEIVAREMQNADQASLKSYGVRGLRELRQRLVELL